MRIRLAFLNAGPGFGHIRAHITDQLGTPVLIVGTYARNGDEWTAVLWGRPGDPESGVATMARARVDLLRNAVAKQGKWWQ